MWSETVTIEIAVQQKTADQKSTQPKKELDKLLRQDAENFLHYIIQRRKDQIDEYNAYCSLQEQKLNSKINWIVNILNDVSETSNNYTYEDHWQLVSNRLWIIESQYKSIDEYEKLLQWSDSNHENRLRLGQLQLYLKENNRNVPTTTTH